MHQASHLQPTISIHLSARRVTSSKPDAEKASSKRKGTAREVCISETQRQISLSSCASILRLIYKSLRPSNLAWTVISSRVFSFFELHLMLFRRWKLNTWTDSRNSLTICRPSDACQAMTCRWRDRSRWRRVSQLFRLYQAYFQKRRCRVWVCEWIGRWRLFRFKLHSSCLSA